MRWDNTTLEGKRQISLACRVTQFGVFNTSDKVRILDQFTGQLSDKTYTVSDWGKFFDHFDHIPDDWQMKTPVTWIDGYGSQFGQIATIYIRPPKDSNKGKPCSKPACKVGTCAGKEWCTCQCDHWFDR